MRDRAQARVRVVAGTMKHSTGSPTKSQQARFRALQELGCIACRKRGFGYAAPDVHHILDGGRRMGHDQTIPLCPHHHRNVAPEGITSTQARLVLGPSLADSPRLFREVFGTERELLAEVDALIAKRCAA